MESADAVELGNIRGAISFDHVDFGYDPAVPVLEDVNLRIAPGETVAFVGPTGAGKSTMAKLVTRFYDPTSGRVLIDGFDLREVTLHSLRRQLGVVPQEPFLFAGRSGTTSPSPGQTPPPRRSKRRWSPSAHRGDRAPGRRLDTVVHERGQSLSSGSAS